MPGERDDKLEWLARLIDETGLKASKLATNAGLADTTLTRFLANPAEASIPKNSTLNKIAIANGMRPYSVEDAAAPPGFQDDGAELLDDSAPLMATIKNDISQVISEKCPLALYKLKGRALELAAVNEGDLLLVDAAARPQNGDIICVALRDEAARSSKTVFRILAAASGASAAITATNDESITDRIIFLDGINAACYGVVKYIIRKKY